MTTEHPDPELAAEGVEPMNADGDVIRADYRALFHIIAEPSGELVGKHEDGLVAGEEASRLDRETAGQQWQGQPVTHRVERVEILATDDPEDGAPMLTGPIVSSETVGLAGLERGERPPDLTVDAG